MFVENLKEHLRSDGLGFDAEILHALAARDVSEQVGLMLEIADAMAGVICQDEDVGGASSVMQLFRDVRLPCRDRSIF